MPSASTTLRLQPTRQAPSLARQALRDCHANWPDETLHATLTVLSELVTNAVVHGDGVITVAIECRSDAVAVAVGDDGEGGPRIRNCSADADSGRGMVVVDSLASEWGVRPSSDGAGKAVWARIGALAPTQGLT
jgi:serine/threonine-protein kinase RsbW